MFWIVEFFKFREFLAFLISVLSLGLSLQRTDTEIWAYEIAVHNFMFHSDAVNEMILRRSFCSQIFTVLVSEGITGGLQFWW